MIFHRRYRPLGAAAALAVAFALMGLPVRAPAAEISPALKQVIEGAKKEGALTLSYAENIMGGTQGSRVAAAGIKKLFGVTLNVTFTPGPSFAPMAAKLYTEMQADQKASTDVYNGTAVQVDPFLKRGLFRAVDWPQLLPGRITPELAEAGGRALRIVTALPGVLYNKRTAPEFGKVVTTADLLKPEYKGKLFTTPYLAGFDVLVADSMWGYPRTAAFVQKLSAQVGGLAPCAATDRIASGEIPALAIDCSGSEQNLARYHGVLGHVILHDAAMRRYNYLCIPKNAAHPDAGILFALYASTPEGQKKIGRDLYGADLDSYPETETHARVTELQKEGVKFQDVTIAWWGSQHNIGSDLKKLIEQIAHK
ncbi:MAG TPA: extracellular solute-binding protein [Stellaceae bacterium]|nr:extracellular solute-binding protein [Stellaceae bacterium]